MTIGIIGSGAIGAAVAERWRASASRQPSPTAVARIRRLVRELGPSTSTGTNKQATRADIVVVAVNWSNLRAALNG